MTGTPDPQVRKYLVQQIAREKPDAVFMTGDLPFNGADPADWQVYRDETAAWSAEHLRVYPTLGNHDVKGGWDEGVRNFNATFPELKGYLYYSVRSAMCTSLPWTAPSPMRRVRSNARGWVRNWSTCQSRWISSSSSRTCRSMPISRAK